MIGILLDRSTRGLNQNRAVHGADPHRNRRDGRGPCRRERQSRPVDTITEQIQACRNQRKGHNLVLKLPPGVFPALNICDYLVGQRHNFDNQSFNMFPIVSPVSPTPVPGPSTFSLLTVAALLMVLRRKTRKHFSL